MPHQTKAQATPPTLGSAVKLTKEKLKVAKPGAFNSGVQSGYTAILRAPAYINPINSNDNYPSVLGTMRFSTIKTKQSPQGSGNVNISCGGSMLSGSCSFAERTGDGISVSYIATNNNYTRMLLRILNLQNYDPTALLPSHWVKSIEGIVNVPINRNAMATYTIGYYTSFPAVADVVNRTSQEMNVRVQKN